MAAAKSKKSGSSKGKSSGRCWTGYEPVPGKAPGSKGSCKPKSSSKKSTAWHGRKTAKSK